MFNIVAITTDSREGKPPVFNATSFKSNAPKGVEGIIEDGFRKAVDRRRSAKKPSAKDSLTVTVYSGYGDLTIKDDGTVEMSESGPKLVDTATNLSKDDFDDMKHDVEQFWDKLAILNAVGALK